MATIDDLYGINAVIAGVFDDKGNVDLKSLENLINHLINAKCNGITMFGLATEFHKLCDKERDAMAKLLCDKCKGTDTYSVLSITDHSKEVAVNRAKLYESMGADALMILPPFFLNPSIEQIKEHIFAILDSVNIPVLIQYAPGETKKIIEVEEMASIKKKYPKAIFKLEPNPPMDYVKSMLQLAPDTKIMIGYAGLYMIDVLNAGGVGTMPGCSFAEIYIKIYNQYINGKKEEATELHKKLMRYVKVWMTGVEYIIAIEKLILAKRGIISSAYCRAPYYTLTKDDEIMVDKFLEEFKDIL